MRRSHILVEDERKCWMRMNNFSEEGWLLLWKHENIRIIFLFLSTVVGLFCFNHHHPLLMMSLSVLLCSYNPTIMPLLYLSNNKNLFFSALPAVEFFAASSTTTSFLGR
jgi:hypothetical protein